MKILGLLYFFCVVLVLNGCGTGPFLKPYAPIGKYNTENPACPGAENVLEIELPGYNWLILRVLAKEPTKYRPEGTRLIVYVMPDLYKHPDPGGSWSLFPSEEEIVRNLEPETVISNKKLEAFIVQLPSLLIDGAEFVIPPVEFKVSESKYAPVLNC